MVTQGDKRQRRGLHVKVASGDGWALLYPSWRWELLTEEERAAVIREQTAAMEKRPLLEKTGENMV